ncbi:MAG: ABC-F family ATP-binding cassette domain-containing protein, partial [Clostridia bacterium]|nr:ABC-F family ATP-binding cassette domain-containing protein [Clostridia bacterium]
MNLLGVSNLKKEFNGETLFDGVSFSIEKGDKIGLVGVNGAGKTTLFKILTGELNHDGGEIFPSKELKIGYLSQHALSGERLTLYGEIESAFNRCKELEVELSKTAKALENAQNGDLNTLIERQENLLKEYEEQGGYVYKSKITGTLIGLGFSEDDFDRQVSSLSGGQKTRLSLAKTLLSGCNLLLLDEPTNHLDLTSVVWLENFIKASNSAVVVISHDRYFLDRVTNTTFDLELGKLAVYKGGYTHFIEQKELRKKTEIRAFENTSKEIDRLQKSADLLHSFNREKSVKRAESKEKQIEKLKQNLTAVQEVHADMKFSFTTPEIGGKEVVTLENLSKSFGDNLLFEKVNQTLMRGERAFILGANGTGKTTLLKIILVIENATNGKAELGYRITTAYYDQTLEGLTQETPR